LLERALRLIDLRLVGANLRLLHLELRIDIHTGLGGCDLRLGLLEPGAIVAIIDARNHVAAFDVLVVGDGDGSEIARHLLGASEDCRAAMKASSVDWKWSA